MSSEQFAGVLRAVLAAAGGYVVARGFVDNATMLTVVGALVTLATAGWSVWAKKTVA